MHLFDGLVNENALPDGARLHTLGLGDGWVLFMLLRQGWVWEMGGDGFVLWPPSPACGTTGPVHMATGNAPITEGRHN